MHIDTVFDNIIDILKNLIFALSVYSIIPMQNNVRVKYFLEFQDQFPNLRKKKDVDRKKYELLERVYLLEQLREGCHRHHACLSEDDLLTMTNDEIVDEINFLSGNDDLQIQDISTEVICIK